MKDKGSFFAFKKGASFLYPGLSYVPGSTFVHSAHPIIKLLVLIIFNLTVFSLAHYSLGLILFGILLATYQVAGLGFSFFWQKLRIIIVFSLLIFLVQIFFLREGYLIAELVIWKFRLGIWSAGLFEGLSLALRFINVIASSFLFVSVTDPNRLAYSLMQGGLPYRLGFMLITALRFIPVFHRELNQVRYAQMAKGIDLEKVSLRKLGQYVYYLLIPLVISALEKVDSLTISMESRAFGLYPSRTYLTRQALTATDWLTFLLFLAFFLALHFAVKMLVFLK
ncbi:MAG: energy-coupling factor transporter transmembrane protein EcfT [Firmicutes bacterium]|nr:energy-coupling factor transporter transmembrane protein EcfT [Bacillota bacterium]